MNKKLSFSRLGIWSSYNCSYEKSIDESRETDILESVNGFSLNSWIVTLVTLILIAIISDVHYKLNNVPFSGIFMAIRWAVVQPYLHEINFVSNLIGMTSAMFTFLIIVCHFENVIKSDKVTVYTPKVYDSYQEIYDDMSVKLLIETWRMDQIKKLPRNDPVFNLYDRAQKNNLGSGVTLKHVNDMMTTETNIVFISSMFILEIMSKRLCDMMSTWSRRDICYYISEDEYQENSPEAILSSKMFQKKKIHKSFLSKHRISVEFGVRDIELIKDFDRTIVTPNNADCLPRYRKSPVTHDRTYEPFGIRNYIGALVLLLILSMISVATLYYELWKNYLFS